MTPTRLHSRRTLMATGGLSLGLLAAGRVGMTLAQDEATPIAIDMADMEEAKVLLKDRLDEFTHIWRATSPATRSGDTYTLTMRNVSGAEQALLVITTLMDHREHYNPQLLVEDISLAAGETRELRATNTYGVANHFHTTVLANTGLVTDIQLLVVVEDSAAVETARFTQNAFMIDNIDELRSTAEGSAEERRARRRKRRQKRRDHDTDHTATPTT